MTRIWWLAILMMGMAGCSHKLATNTTTSTAEADVPSLYDHAKDHGNWSDGNAGTELESRHAAKLVGGEDAFRLVKHTHSVQIVGRGIKVNIDYADNDPEAVDVFAQGIADYLNSLGDNPEFPEAK